MATMTKSTVNVGAWTSIYTSTGAVNASIQNLDSAPMKVRIGIGAAIGDSLEAAADVLLPMEWRTYALILNEVVLVQPLRTTTVGPATANVNLRA